MPGWGSEERHDTDRSKAGTAAVKSWLVKNLTKKKREVGSEDGSSVNQEPSVVSTLPSHTFQPLFPHRPSSLNLCPRKEYKIWASDAQA
jgi:hypothetical protein